MIRQLIGHSAAYTFANLLARGTVLVWLIVLPHFLSAADYGALGLVTTIAAIVNVVVPLEISQALARYYPGAPEAERRSWASSAWSFTLLALAGAAALAFVFSERLNRLLFGSDRYLTVFQLSIAYFAVNTSFVFTQNQFRWAFRPRGYTLVTAIFAVVTLVLSVGLAAVFADALEGVLIGLVIGAAVGVIAGVAGLRNALGLGIDRARLVRMLRFSLPLVPASISILLSTYASRFILNGMLTLKEVGVYTWASQLGSIPALLLLGVQGAITPLVMKHHAEPGTPAILARSFETIVAAELCLCLAIALFTPELISLLGYGSFASAASLVLILAPANLLLQLYVFAPGFAVAQRTDLQLAVSIV
ncbi:MAG TPA: oligosaccharide flippase family protein, partial [Sphingomicrobium sp.]|nr:oligosaccharide flippase family protein [Sphingomicrobium sp.]